MLKGISDQMSKYVLLKVPGYNVNRVTTHPTEWFFSVTMQMLGQ
jgi:hypothetical protein